MYDVACLNKFSKYGYNVLSTGFNPCLGRRCPLALRFYFDNNLFEALVILVVVKFDKCPT